jgi:hypothetical protein
MMHYSLQLLLGDITSQAFFEEYFQKKWLHRKAGATSGPLGDLVTLRDLELLLFDGDRRDRVLLAVGGPSTPPGGKDTPNRRCSAAEAIHEWAIGKTLVFNGIDCQLPAVHALARGLEGELKCQVTCNLYLTPAYGHGFQTHFDPHEVFVLQLIGRKRWRVGANAADAPMSFQMHEQVFPEINDDQSRILLEVGDLLYIPRGRLHDAVADDELSCHLTIGLHPRTYLDAIMAAVMLAAYRNGQFRKYLPLGSFALGNDVVAEAHRIMDLISMEDFRQVGDAFCERLASQRWEPPVDVLDLHGKSGQFSENDYFRAVPYLMCSVSRTTDAIELRALAKSLSFPLNAACDLELCCSGKAFRLSDLRGQSSLEARSDFVRRLMIEGVIRRLAAEDSLGDVSVDVIKHSLVSARERYLMATSGLSGQDK